MLTPFLPPNHLLSAFVSYMHSAAENNFVESALPSTFYIGSGIELRLLGLHIERLTY